MQRDYRYAAQALGWEYIWLTQKVVQQESPIRQAIYTFLREVSTENFVINIHSNDAQFERFEPGIFTNNV